MTNLEKYNASFIEVFSVKEEDLMEKFTNKHVSEWDSIRQLSLVASIEESFDIMFDTEDILGLNSYNFGMELLRNKYEIKF